MSERVYESTTLHCCRAIFDAHGNVVLHRAWTEPAGRRVLRSVHARVRSGQDHTFRYVIGLDQHAVDEVFRAKGRALRVELANEATARPSSPQHGDSRRL